MPEPAPWSRPSSPPADLDPGHATVLALIAGLAFVVALVAALVGWGAAGDLGGNRLLGALDAAAPWVIAGAVAEVGLALRRP